MGGGDVPQADEEVPPQVIDIPIEDLSSEFHSALNQSATFPGGNTAAIPSSGDGEPPTTESRVPFQQPKLPSDPPAAQAEAAPSLSQQNSGNQQSSRSNTSLQQQDDFRHQHHQNRQRRSCSGHRHHHHGEDEYCSGGVRRSEGDVYSGRRISTTQPMTSSAAGDHNRQVMHERYQDRSRRSGYDDQDNYSRDEDDLIDGTIICHNIIEVDPSKVVIGEGNRAGRRLRGRISGNAVLP